jgi:magnesium chelatase subunit D
MTRDAMLALWADAELATALLAIDPRGLAGLRIMAPAGPVRDGLLARYRALAGADRRMTRVAPTIPLDRLTGGVDLAASLAAGRPVRSTGLVDEGGTIVLALAERVEASVAGTIAQALDRHAVALIALDEGEGDEALPQVLGSRLALATDLRSVALIDLPQPTHDRASIKAAQEALASVELPPTLLEALVAMTIGHPDAAPRRLVLIARIMRAAAALRGATVADEADAALALRLSFATDLPAREPADAPAESQDGEDAQGAENSKQAAKSDSGQGNDGGDMLVEAIAARLPAGLLFGADANASRGGAGGRHGKALRGTRRGRTIGYSERPPFPDATPDVLATLRAALPLVRLRPPTGQSGIIPIRRSDFRYRRLSEPAGTTTIFAVDASGSAAIERLGEAKGAVELLLAECYSRRDAVALIAFRGTVADRLLPPSRSLLAAKRRLTSLPGGGGTPLARGLADALQMALDERRKGQSVTLVLLTDGRANITLSGAPGRPQARLDALDIARKAKASGLRALVVDSGGRPQAAAREIADAMGARYLALPHGRPQLVGQAVAAL